MKNMEYVTLNLLKISDKRIAIKFESYELAKEFLELMTFPLVTYFHDEYEESTCINVIDSAREYEYTSPEYYTELGYSFINYNDFVEGDFYLINDKVVLIKE